MRVGRVGIFFWLIDGVMVEIWGSALECRWRVLTLTAIGSKLLKSGCASNKTSLSLGERLKKLMQGTWFGFDTSLVYGIEKERGL